MKTATKKEKKPRPFIKEPTVKFKLVREFYEKCKCEDDTEIPFSAIVGSFFPNILDNIQKEMGRQYIQGYTEARTKYESKGN